MAEKVTLIQYQLISFTRFFWSIRMGNGLSLPCESDAIRSHTIREILRSPAVADLIDSVSEYIRNRTGNGRKQARHSRNGHGRHERFRHAWPEISPSAGWIDGDRDVALSQCGETRFSPRDPRPVIYHPMFPTYNHRQDTHRPRISIHDNPFQPSYRSSSQTYRCRDNLRCGTFDSNYESEPRMQRRGRNSGHRPHPASNFYDVPSPGPSDDGHHGSPIPPRRQRSRQHRHLHRHAEFPPDGYQSRGSGIPGRHRAPYGLRPGKSSYRTPSLSALSEKHHDFGTSRDGSTEG